MTTYARKKSKLTKRMKKEEGQNGEKYNAYVVMNTAG